MDAKNEEITLECWQLLEEKSKQWGVSKAQLVTEAINAFFGIEEPGP